MLRRSIILALPALALAGIFYLAQQNVHDTQDLAWRVEQLLVRLVPPTGTGSSGEPTWCGLTIRRLAHVGEFFVLGLAMVAAVALLAPASPHAPAAVACLGLAAALADECHKIFVPGRHFDPYDLLLDLAGTLLALAVWLILARLASSLH